MIRFYNGKLLSLSGGFEISDWEVWVEESMILYVGPIFKHTLLSFLCFSFRVRFGYYKP